MSYTAEVTDVASHEGHVGNWTQLFLYVGKLVLNIKSYRQNIFLHYASLAEIKFPIFNCYK